MSEFDVIFDGSRQNFFEVPAKILQMYNLRMLYLEGNNIKFLPDEFFPKLHQLTWLDLRNNRLEAIPETIAYHQHLENLLLTNNKIESLPNELGLVATLKVLQISDNPILYPSRKIIAKGTKTICQYLQKEYKKSNPEIELNQEETQTDNEEIVELEEVNYNFQEIPVKKQESASIFVKSLSKNQQQQQQQRQPQPPREEDKILHKITRDASKISLKSSYHSREADKVEISDYAVLHKAQLRENWIKKLKALLSEQEKILQQEKNLRALHSWRQERKAEPIVPSDYNLIEKAPYGTYPEYNGMLSRDELSQQIDKLIQKTRSPPKKTNIEKLINELVSELKNVESTCEEVKSPRSEIEEAGKQIQMIMTIYKKLQTLQANNDSTL